MLSGSPIDGAGGRRPEAARPRPSRDLARGGVVRVSEYRCVACAGDRPQPEEFPHASVSIVRSGVFGIRSEHGSQLLASGFLLLGNRGQQYEAFHEHAWGDRCLVFDFEGEVLEQMAESLRRGAGRRPFARTVQPPLPRVDALCHLAEERLTSGRPTLGLEELALELATCALKVAGRGTERPAPAPRDDARQRARVRAAMELFERCASEELHLEDMARRVGLSPFHFLRLFKREAGVTPHQFLIRARIRRAIPLLRDTSRPVTEIAYDVGFGDLSNFIHAFRREVGCSPRQYRNVHRGDGLKLLGLGDSWMKSAQAGAPPARPAADR